MNKLDWLGEAAGHVRGYEGDSIQLAARKAAEALIVDWAEQLRMGWEDQAPPFFLKDLTEVAETLLVIQRELTEFLTAD